MTVNNKKIYRLSYIKTSDLGTLLSRTLNYGDLVTAAEIKAVTPAWQDLSKAEGFTKLTMTKKSIELDQFGAKIKDKVSIPGFYDVSGTLPHVYKSSDLTDHLDILKNGFGTLVSKSVSTTVNSVTSSTALELTDASGLAVGDIIKIGDDFQAVIETISTNDVTLLNPVNATAGDTVTCNGYWNIQELEDPTESYFLLVHTALTTDVVAYAKWGIDLTTKAQDFLKMDYNFQGDYLINMGTYKPTITQETTFDSAVTTEFSGVTVGGAKSCFSTFELGIKRVMERLKCNGTESQTGNGGTNRDDFTTELKAVAFSLGLEANYIANSQFDIYAQKGEISIYAPKSRIKDFNKWVEEGNLQAADAMIYLNTDMQTDMKITLT